MSCRVVFEDCTVMKDSSRRHKNIKHTLSTCLHNISSRIMSRNWRQVMLRLKMSTGSTSVKMVKRISHGSLVNPIVAFLGDNADNGIGQQPSCNILLGEGSRRSLNLEDDNLDDENIKSQKVKGKATQSQDCRGIWERCNCKSLSGSI